MKGTSDNAVDKRLGMFANAQKVSIESDTRSTLKLGVLRMGATFRLAKIHTL